MYGRVRACVCASVRVNKSVRCPGFGPSRFSPLGLELGELKAGRIISRGHGCHRSWCGEGCFFEIREEALAWTFMREDTQINDIRTYTLRLIVV